MGRLPRTEDQAKDALNRLIDNAFSNPGARAFASIPANPHEDADLILIDVVEEWVAIKALNTELLAACAVAESLLCWYALETGHQHKALDQLQAAIRKARGESES